MLKLDHLSYNINGKKSDIFNLSLHEREVHAIIISSDIEQEALLSTLTDNQNKEINNGLFFESPLLNINSHDYKYAILYKDLVLNDNLSITENVYLPHLLKYKFMPFINWNKMNTEVARFFRAVNINIDPKRKLNTFTKEQKKIVQLSKIFFHPTDFIIMHEPMEGLTAENVNLLQRFINNYLHSGKSIFYITKRWEETLKISNRISIISNGKIKLQISADEAKMNTQQLVANLEGYSFNQYASQENEAKSFIDTVFKVSEFISSEYELQDVLLFFTKEVVDFFNAENCLIQLLDEPTWSVIDEYKYSKNNFEYNISLKENVIKNIFESNTLFYSNVKDKDFTSYFKDFNENYEIKSVLCLPVQIKSRVTGIIQIFFKKLQTFTQKETKYLYTLSKHIALAIEDSRLIGRSTLLQESHHRIKNSLQSVIGIISMQKSFLRNHNKTVNIEVLNDIILRIENIASVHDLLSKDKLGRSIVNVKSIISKIVDFYKENYPKNVLIKAEVEDLFMSYNRATSIATIVNELMSNAFKHAFTDKEDGEIFINCFRKNKYIYLIVSDNGVGSSYLTSINSESKIDESIGLKILYGIVKNSLKGELNFESNGGLSAKLSIPLQDSLKD